MRIRGPIGDGGVLQHGMKIRLKGSGGSGKVRVKYRGREWHGAAAAGGEWTVTIGPLTAGKGEELAVESATGEMVFGEVKVGSVWLCGGQSNMGYRLAPHPPWTEGAENWEEELESAGDMELAFLTEPKRPSPKVEMESAGRWIASERGKVGEVPAIAYYMGVALRKALRMPVGMITTAVGSTAIEPWLSAEVVAKSLIQIEGENGEGIPAEFGISACHNGMVAAMIGYPVEGWVWYQGEGNTGGEKARDYERKLAWMIEDYRAKWDQPGSPFIIVQLPEYRPRTEENVEEAPEESYGWEAIRQQQAAVAGSVANCALVQTRDISDPSKIHPPQKKEVGKRCAAAALEMLGRSSVRDLSKDFDFDFDLDLDKDFR